LAVPELSLYVHVPFCLGKCSYCDFYSITDLASASRVVDRTIDEGNRALDLLGSPRLATVYVGGGTPSALARPDLRRLLAAISRWCAGPPDELTVEANPETVDDGFVGICAEAGVTRLSVGVQTLEPALLGLLARRATRGETLAALELIARRWKGDLSVDLLAGIPGQSRERLLTDLAEVLRFSPRHVSLYSLTREEGTPYDRRIRAGRLREMPAEEQEGLWLAGVRLLRDRGYRHYEISNFALAGGECRHNVAYWELRPYLGIGPAAVSTLPGGSTGVVRLSRPRSVKGWLAGASARAEEIEARGFLFETLMMGLRLARGVSARAIRDRFGEEALGRLEEVWAAMRG
jgi:oxygen-independent coproporphyrinogen-3 oxidase